MDDDERPTSRRREQGVINTDELDISHDERVARIDSGRYVITTGNTPPRVDTTEAETDAGGPNEAGSNEEGVDAEASVAEVSGAKKSGADKSDTADHTSQEDSEANGDQSNTRREVVLPRNPRKRAIIARRLLTERVGAIQADHAVVATALVDGNVEKHESVSNDVTDVFHSLVSWYADAIGSGETPTDEVLGILLLASEVQVTYPGRAVEALAAAHGLGRDDSIGNLLDAVEESGASFPPRTKR
ncbi:hypothetical protein [Haloferax sp. DFSO52]|uniref:DUF7500 family protein n=1 Tax=Haloferax sp. DFSO52 TaxID=3388505 RepID=UPI003A86BA23